MKYNYSYVHQTKGKLADDISELFNEQLSILITSKDKKLSQLIRSAVDILELHSKIYLSKSFGGIRHRLFYLCIVSDTYSYEKYNSMGIT